MATECNVCDNSYDGETRKPTLLPCYHTFCRHCLNCLRSDNKKTCPICRQSWADVDVATLPVLFQLIPDAAAAKSTKRVWCNSCKTVSCKKCVGVQHGNCQWVTVDNEIATMATKHRDLLVKLHGKIQRYNRINLKNKQFLKNISQFAKELKEEEDEWSNHDQKFELVLKKLNEEQTKVCSYNIEDSLLSESSADNLNKSIFQVTSALKIKVQSLQDSLMTHVVSAFQAEDSTDSASFSKNLTIFEETHEREFNSEAVDEFVDSSEATPSLICNNGGTWSISGSAKAAVAIYTLESTSNRPEELVITGSDWNEISLLNLLCRIKSVNCRIRLKPSDSFFISKETTQKRVGALMSGTKRHSLLEVWGYFDEVTLKTLTNNTIQSLGCVLKEYDDVIVFQTAPAVMNNPSPSHTRCLNLCILQSFMKARRGKPKLLATINLSSISLILHLPYVTTAATFNATLSFIKHIPNIGDLKSRVGALNFPKSSMDADMLLGLLRDWNLRCAVHLVGPEPGGMEKIKTAYKQYNCSVAWDLI